MSGKLLDDWREVQLGDVSRIVTGKTPSTKEPRYWGGDIPFATPSDITDGPWLDHVERHVSSEGMQYSSVVPAGSVLFTCIASIGKSCITREISTLNQQINACVPSEQVDAYFLYNALQARVGDMLNLAGTTAVPIINKTTFSNVALKLPPLDEQQRIAEVLRSMDEAIAAAGDVISQLREMRGHRLEALTALPGTYCRIDEICRLSGGFGFPIKHQGKTSGRYPFAKVSDMNRLGNEVQMRHAENYVDEADLRTLKAKTFPVGTTFFPKVGATLLTNKRRIAAVEMLVDNNVMGAVATDVDPWFLYYAFCTIDMADYVQPGAVPSVNQRTIGQIMIPVPDVAMQQEFVTTMRDLDGAIEMQSDALAQLTANKQALMSDLLSGHVRVPA